MKRAIGRYFKVKDLGEAKFLLGIRVRHDRKSGSIEYLQQAFIDRVLKRFSVPDAKLVTTFVPSGVRLTQDDCVGVWK